VRGLEGLFGALLRPASLCLLMLSGEGLPLAAQQTGPVQGAGFVAAGPGASPAQGLGSASGNGPIIAPGMRARKPDFSTFGTYERRISPELDRLASPQDRSHPEFGILPWDAPCSNCVELPARRTATGRYFVAAGSEGTRFFVQESSGPLHFSDGKGGWLTRDPFLRPTGSAGVYHAPSQPLPTGLDLAAGYASIRMADGVAMRFVGAERLLGETYMPMSAGGLESIPAAADLGAPDRQRMALVGRDGLRAYHAWPGIDLVQLFREGEIETDIVIRDRAALPDGDRIVFRDRWELPDMEHGRYELVALPGSGEWITIAGERVFTGQLQLKLRGGAGTTAHGGQTTHTGQTTLLGLKAPLLFDAAGANSLETPGLIGYRWVNTNSGFVVETVIDAAWLRSGERRFPITVDPLLYGIATYTGGDIGFNYDATCFDLTDYCNASLTVTVPGRTTLTNAWFDAQYFSVLMGCVIGMTDCLMREAAFQIVGPCETSPSAGSYWSCLPPEGDSAGTCFGDSLNMFNTINCIPPSCADHVLTFEMRTFHCSCNGPNCGVICHFMPNNSWKITIEGRTVEENAILSPDEPDFTICQGDTLALTPTGQWGVPPYEYLWLPLGVTADTVFVNPSTDITYTSIIFDACDNTDTVTRDVTVLPAPAPAPGPFDDCVPSVLLDAGPGFVSYFWPHSGETTQTVTVTTAGSYSVEVTDANGCSGTSSPIVAVLNEPPVVNTVPDTLIIDDGSLGQLVVTTTATGLVAYTWSPAATLTCANCPSPLAFPQEPTLYTVFGTQNGCVGEPDSVLVLINQVDLVLPNAFTPNGDGLNDVFRVTNAVLYPVFELSVFNRWGEVIYRSDDIRSGWDGTYRGKEQESGVYIWLIRFRKGSVSGEEVTLTGNVTLLR
jgi:gliding motility-associated-like protein